MIDHTIWVSIYSFKCFKTVWSRLFTSTLFSLCSYRLDRNEMLLKFLRILIKLMHLNDQNWISKSVNCISCSVVCKIAFWSEFTDIPHNAGKVTRGRRRRTQAIPKRYAFHTNANMVQFSNCYLKLLVFQYFDSFDLFFLWLILIIYKKNNHIWIDEELRRIFQVWIFDKNANFRNIILFELSQP